MSLPHKNRGSFINHKMRTNKKNFCTQLLYKSACLLLSNITRNVRLTLSAINCIYSATPKTVVQQGFFFFFHGVVFIPKPHLSWVSLRLVRWISAPQGLLQLKYFNLTKHLIYFISPMRKAVCLNRACQPTAPFTAIYRQPGTLEEKSAVILYFILLQKAPKSSYSLLLHVAF